MTYFIFVLFLIKIQLTGEFSGKLCDIGQEKLVFSCLFVKLGTENIMDIWFIILKQ